MEKLNIPSKTIKVAPKLAKSSKLYKTIIQAIQDKKGENVLSIDLRKTTEAVADFFIVCSANNGPQLKAIADFVTDEVNRVCGEKPYKHEGYTGQQWILIDFVNIVVHVMHPTSRSFYKLEDMWSDADISKVD